MTESQIQKAILDYLGYQRGIYFFRAGSGAVKTDTGRYFKTGKKGLPDIVVCKDGKFIGLEVKTPKGRVSEAQEQAKADIELAGGSYFIVRSIDDVINILNG